MEQPEFVPMLTANEIVKYMVELDKMVARYEAEAYGSFPPDDMPDRHNDYLPLNLWDETPD